MRALFLFPPQWSMNGVAAGAAALSGTLKDLGHTCKVLDLNIGFYNYILTKDFIYKCKQEIEISPHKEVIQEYNEKKSDFLKYIDKLDSAINTLRSPTAFYNMKNLLVSYHIIEQVLKFISLAYYPFIINKFNFARKDSRIKYEDYKLYTGQNIFIEFLRKNVEEIKEYNADYIGISISSDSQMIAALTLAKLLKQNNIKTPIIFGGPNITRRINHIKNDPVLFKEYIDGAIIGAGERATAEYLEFLAGRRSINQVPNLTYMADGIIYENKFSYKTYSESHLFDYSHYDRSKYFLPDGVLLLTTSDSCYYNKCAFCFHNVNSIYKQKKADDVIKEIKEIIKQNKVNKFFITDNALHPVFADEFSRKIIEQKIEIYYSCDIRFEKEFNAKLLNQLYKSGLRVCYWGLESANNRILNFLKKGTTVERNKEILTFAHNAGIFNFVYFMLGIPTETKQEMYETVNFMINNNNIIDACIYNEFNMVKGIDIYNNPEKYGLTKQDVEIENDFDLCPMPLRKVSLEEIQIAGQKVYSVYNRFYNKIFQYGTNELLLLYKAKNINLY